MREHGMFRYLSADGATLLDEPVDVWRMPTVDEIARSLVRRGQHAGCTWNGELGRVSFAAEPDKETPLWAPDASPIYYWALDEASERDAYYVSYNGWVGRQNKNFGNPRHGFRFVKNLP